MQDLKWYHASTIKTGADSIDWLMARMVVIEDRVRLAVTTVLSFLGLPCKYQPRLLFSSHS